jgi:hypothetical protein
MTRASWLTGVAVLAAMSLSVPSPAQAAPRKGAKPAKSQCAVWPCQPGDLPPAKAVKPQSESRSKGDLVVSHMNRARGQVPGFPWQPLLASVLVVCLVIWSCRHWRSRSDSSSLLEEEVTEPTNPRYASLNLGGPSDPVESLTVEDEVVLVPSDGSAFGFRIGLRPDDQRSACKIAAPVADPFPQAPAPIAIARRPVLTLLPLPFPVMPLAPSSLSLTEPAPAETPGQPVSGAEASKSDAQPKAGGQFVIIDLTADTEEPWGFGTQATQPTPAVPPIAAAS